MVKGEYEYDIVHKSIALVYHKYSGMFKARDSMYRAKEQVAKNLSCEMGNRSEISGR